MNHTSIASASAASTQHAYWQSDFARSVARRSSGQPDLQPRIETKPGALRALAMNAVPATETPGRNMLARIHKLAVAAWLVRAQARRARRQNPAAASVAGMAPHGGRVPARRFRLRAGMNAPRHEGEAA